MSTTTGKEKLIAVIGATGQQGGGVVRALRAAGQFRVRALSRNPDKHRDLADEVVEADLDRPETLTPAFDGAHGVFLVTNIWEEGTDELEQATASVRAARDAGVDHFIWSTLPNVEAVSGGKFNVPHFTGKAGVDRIVRDAGFAHHTFVIAPFYYQNLTGALAPQQQADGSLGWVLPVDPAVRCIHMGDIRELGNIVAGAFAQPDQDVFSAFFPGATELAEMFSYFQAHTYLGSDSDARIALANKIAGRQPTDFATWARLNVPVQAIDQEPGEQHVAE
jgi:uncharacterized protein YbjT (DUF2867 family)